MEGLIHEGDELREVNGVSLEHRNPKEIPSLLVGLVAFPSFLTDAATNAQTDAL